MSEVKPGQVWADNDWRSEGRTLRVDSVSETHAECTVLTDVNDEHRWSGAKSQVGRTTRIMLRRFKPTSTGYKLVKEAVE